MYMTVFKMDKEGIDQQFKARHEAWKAKKMHPESLKNMPYTRLDMQDGNSVHKWITAQQNATRQAGKLLYRVMRDNNGDECLYIQSSHPFNTENALTTGLKIVGEPNRDIEEEFAQLTPETPIAFSVRVTPLSQCANQIYTFEDDTPDAAFKEKPHSQKLFIRDGQARLEWIQKKLKAGGLAIFGIREEKKEDICFTTSAKQENGDIKTRRVSMAACDYFGVALVQDMTAFKKMVETGIGKHKNYGTGLLMFKPVSVIDNL